MPPRRLLDEFSSHEISEQIAFEAIEPMPDFYWMNALHCAITAQVAGCKNVRMEKFFPNYKPKRATSPDEMRTLVGFAYGFAK